MILIIPAGFFYLSMNWKNPFAKKKEDSVIDVIELLQTINNRKIKHLHDCLKAVMSGAKIPYATPQSFITDYETKILDRLHGPKADEIKKLVLKSFDEEPDK